MKHWRTLLLLPVAMIVAVITLQAQLSGPITVSAVDASGTCATANACAVFPGGSINAYGIDVSGTFSGTLSFEQTIDGTNYRAVMVTNLATGASVTSTTAPGSFGLGNTGFLTLRARASSWSSGSAAVGLRRGYLTAKNSGIDASGNVLAAQTVFPLGSAGAPSITFVTKPTHGLYFDGNGVGISQAGTEALGVNNTGVILTNAFPLGFSSSASGNVDTIVGRNGAGLLYFTNQNITPLIKLSIATGAGPALSACGDGALQTGSSNSMGRVVSAATMTGCTLTYSSTFAGNSTECFINNLVAARGFVSAASSTAFTVSGLTAGDDFSYWCAGR